MKRIVVGILVCAALIGCWLLWQRQDRSNTSASQQTAGTKKSFDKTQHSLADPASIWVIANKQRPLAPATYAPQDLIIPAVPLRLTAKDAEMQLRQEAARALEDMYQAAKGVGLPLMISSAYRSYASQKTLYNRYVSQQGQAVADTQSARPGHSEHQTGLAVDIEPTSRTCEVEACFADTPEGQWAANNAYKYGFIIRYPENKQAITGYIYEPWHLRYVGIPLAMALHDQNNPTLEEFFGVKPAPDYK